MNKQPDHPQSVIAMEQVSIDDLRPDPANPRKIGDAELEALTRSLREFGFVQPVLARRADRVVVGGHQRLLAARKLGLKAVPVIYLDLSVDQSHVLNLALNQISGEWDEDLLARLLADLGTEADVDLSLTGFSEGELKGFLRSLDKREKRERLESFDLDQALEEARSQGRVSPGELWALGEHRLLCGDATDQGVVGRLMGSTRAQVAFNDPPYNVAYGDHGGQQEGARKRRIQNDALSPEQWETFCRGWAANLLQAVDGALYICMSSREWPTVARVLAEAGGHWSDSIIWAKDHFTLGRAAYQRQYEPIWFGWREGAQPFWCGDRDQGDVWQIARPSESPLHPTMKPLPLIERALENSSKPGDLVLDLFLGSGSTLIAAERTGRGCYGTELDAAYAAVVLRRWEAFSGETAVLIAETEGAAR